ncbi:MAG: prepilin peptidase [Patescibacteria group bacterium]
MILALAVIIGLAFGSFLNVLVFRVHADIPMTGRSKCVKCETPIDARDLVPVLSFFLLRGRCRACKAVIAWQYPLVEFATAVTFLLIAIPLTRWEGLDELAGLAVATFIAQATITLFLIIIFVYDFKYSYILDRFTVPAMILAVLFNWSLPNLWWYIDKPISMLLGALVIGGFFFAQYAISRGRWIGGGDIRMGVLMGLWLGIERGLLALLISYVVGAFVGVVLLLTHRKGLESHIPLGTFLAFGTFIAMIWGWQIIEWYFGYFV